MSCMIMNYESLAALANAVETRLNCGYDFWGFEAPDSLFRELSDCKTTYLYSAEDIYRRLYALNVRAYNGRYVDHEEPEDETAPVIDGSKYVVHRLPEYREHGFAVQDWHYQLAQLLDFWLYQTSELATYFDPLRQAMQEFRDILFRFIIRNSPQYADMRWGRLPPVSTEALYDNMAYHINTIPGEAATHKGHADYPDDFPHLRSGEDFTAWRNGRQWEIETTLNGDALLDRLKALKQQDTRAQTQELQYIFSFASEGCFDTEVACDQLRSLWTAYCLRYGLVVDTHRYDSDLSTVWARVAAGESDTAFWSDYDGFDGFMCTYLV